MDWIGIAAGTLWRRELQRERRSGADLLRGGGVGAATTSASTTLASLSDRGGNSTSLAIDACSAVASAATSASMQR